jgi:hypothetical protein
MGDKFDNIQSSTIVNRSAVQNAFNRLSANSEAELRAALKEIAEAVESPQDPEASDLAESLIEEAAGSKRAVACWPHCGSDFRRSLRSYRR